MDFPMFGDVSLKLSHQAMSDTIYSPVGLGDKVLFVLKYLFLISQNIFRLKS